MDKFEDSFRHWELGEGGILMNSQLQSRYLLKKQKRYIRMIHVHVEVESSKKMLWEIMDTERWQIDEFTKISECR